ncbi:MAG: DUF6178 family protein [Candidatus Methylomirabilota bacterium]
MMDERGSLATDPEDAGLHDRELLALELGRRGNTDGLDWLLAQERPAALLRRLPEQDCYWLAKGCGSEECIALLALCSEAQWQHLLDLEIWDRDRLDLEAVGRWLTRLIQADAPRLIEWLFGGEGELLAYAYLSRLVDVFIPEPDAGHLVPEGFTDLDGVHFIRIREPELRPALETLLRALAAKDSRRSASFLETLAGLIPGEAEEELYRFRTARLEEKGFRPFAEALAAYAPLDPESLRGEPILPVSRIDSADRALAPLLPLARLDGGNPLSAALERIGDPVLLDRLRLEFATLANQLLSAEGLPGLEYADLLGACRKSLAHVGLALEATAAGDHAAAEALLRRHHLLALFRAGLGVAMRLKREMEAWRAASWFRRQGLPDGFWGAAWEGVVAGLSRPRPLHFSGEEGAAGYREFARLAEVETCRLVLRRLRLLDRLLERLTETHPPEAALLAGPAATFHPLLFNAWALGEAERLERLPIERARAFLAAWHAAVRAAAEGARKAEAGFVDRFAPHLSALVPDEAELARSTLALLYREFAEEYAAVAPEDLDPRYSRLLAIRYESTP